MAIDPTGKPVHAHGGCFDRACRSVYRMNSPEVCEISAARPEIGIIELGLRKSEDGFLYCDHGTFFKYYFSLKFPKTFAALRAKYEASLLEDLLAVIPESKIIFL